MMRWINDEGAEVPNAGQATARQAQEITDAEIVEFIGAELASQLSAVSRRFGLSQEQMRARLDSLKSRGLVRVQGIVDSAEAVYSLTQDGARKIESMRKGITV